MGKNYHASKSSAGGYQGKAEGGQRASVRSATQAGVIKELRQIMHAQGGGELKIHGMDGKIRASDTVPPKTDHFPPKG